MDIFEPMGSVAPQSNSGAQPAPAPTPDLIGGAAPDNNVRTGTYELMAIFPATYAEEELARLVEKVKSALAEHGVSVTATEDFGKRKLAFPIKHIRQGYYQLFALEGPKSSLRKLDGSLRLMPEVLRHLITVRRVRTQEELEAEAAFRERIHAKRMAKEEKAVAERQAREFKERPPEQPVREVSKEELEKKLEEILTDETLGE